MTAAACTVVTRNYLPFGRLVARSWLDHHPGATFTLLVVDPEAGPPPAWTHRDVRVVAPCDVGLDGGELRRMAGIYGPAEMACALKPWVLRHVLAQPEVDAAVYVDGDVEVMAPMDELAELARSTQVVLVPHGLEPFPDDALRPDRFTMLLSGMYNGGLLAVGRAGCPFLDWWAERLRRDGIAEPSQGMLLDQRWLDFVPSCFDHRLLKDPTYDVAYWNLHERPTSWDGERLLVGGRPVRCFHYSGLVDAAPWRLSGFTGDLARVELRDEPAVARVCRRYLDQLRALDVDGDRSIPYGYRATATGLVLDVRARRLYRRALLNAEEDSSGATAEPPGPFHDDGGAGFLEWLRTPAHAHGALGRYLEATWQDTHDLIRGFPDAPVDPLDAARLRRWLALDGGTRVPIPDALLPEREEPVVPDLPDTMPFRHRGPKPEVRSQQPVADLEAARRLLERGRAEERLPAGARSVVDRILRTRDVHHQEVAAHLLGAVEELTSRLAALGERVNGINDLLPEQANRMDHLTGELQASRAEQERVAAQAERDLHLVRQALDAERARLDGALEQDLITGSIVVDAEQRLSSELAELRRRIDKLLQEASLDAPTEPDPSADTDAPL